jgi:hypothetical protein
MPANKKNEEVQGLNTDSLDPALAQAKHQSNIENRHADHSKITDESIEKAARQYAAASYVKSCISPSQSPRVEQHSNILDYAH